jgi:hypothetical protein
MKNLNPFDVYIPNTLKREELKNWFLEHLSKDILMEGHFPIKIMKKETKKPTFKNFINVDERVSIQLHAQIMICANTYFNPDEDVNQKEEFEKLYSLIIKENKVKGTPTIFFNPFEEFLDEDIRSLTKLSENKSKVSALQISFEKMMQTQIGVNMDITHTIDSERNNTMVDIIDYLGTLSKKSRSENNDLSPKSSSI